MLTILRQNFSKLLDIKLLLTAIAAGVILHFISQFITLSQAIQLMGAGFVYILGVAKELLPKVIEKKINETVPLSNELIYRLEIIENRLDECYQIALRSQAVIEASAVDEYLEEERLNMRAIAEIKKELEDLKNQDFWQKYLEEKNSITHEL